MIVTMKTKWIFQIGEQSDSINNKRIPNNTYFTMPCLTLTHKCVGITFLITMIPYAGHKMRCRLPTHNIPLWTYDASIPSASTHKFIFIATTSLFICKTIGLHERGQLEDEGLYSAMSPHISHHLNDQTCVTKNPSFHNLGAHYVRDREMQQFLNNLINDFDGMM